MFQNPTEQTSFQDPYILYQLGASPLQQLHVRTSQKNLRVRATAEAGSQLLLGMGQPLQCSDPICSKFAEREMWKLIPSRGLPLTVCLGSHQIYVTI